ncbi:MAG: SCP2 sterol-binding domain-containing protein [Candidatus Dormibacteraeota bacterium]|jgi:putative sterol carrier protein|nr:SCP2 sterol-binding domain-containing protein [Candidatus Dormibacteraeota bacterium]
MSEVQLSPDQIVEALPRFLIPEKAGSTKATIQFDLSGEHGGKWWVKIADGKAESGKGDAPDPANLTVAADSGDFVKIMLGQMDAMSAFMTRKLQVKGDMGLAVKLQTLFKRPT